MRASNGVAETEPGKSVDMPVIENDAAPLSPGAWVDLAAFDRSGFAYGRSRRWVQLWRWADTLLFRHSPTLLFGWRRWLLRVFGAKIGRGVRIWPRVRVHLPWKIEIGDHSVVGEEAWLYSVDRIRIGRHCSVSQKTVLCTASHDPAHARFRTTTGPIVIEDGAWVAMDCFVAPGVTIGANTVVGARSTVLKSLPPGKICFGHPCEVRKDRVIVKQERSTNGPANPT